MARSFGDYEVLAKLATGGAASIFLARQPRPPGPRLVVLKVLLPERAASPSYVDMFLDEGTIGSRLRHPNWVEVHDVGRIGGIGYIAMEYVLGETLWSYLVTVSRLRQPLPPTAVATIIVAAAEGLHHAHELTDDIGRPYHLIHRDISPQNLMITASGTTKLLDLGIVKADTGRSPTASGIVKGKFSYMSPEQIIGGSLDRRSDVYSLGIVLFECLASRRLYPGDNPEQIARMIHQQGPPRLRDVVPTASPVLDEICAKALARKPAERYQTARELGQALRRYLDDFPANLGQQALLRIVEERFGAVLTERKRACERALQGVPEHELYQALGAQPIREIDFRSVLQEVIPARNTLSRNEPNGRPLARRELSAHALMPQVAGFQVAPNSDITQAQPDPWRSEDSDSATEAGKSSELEDQELLRDATEDEVDPDRLASRLEKVARKAGDFADQDTINEEVSQVGVPVAMARPPILADPSLALRALPPSTPPLVSPAQSGVSARPRISSPVPGVAGPTKLTLPPTPLAPEPRSLTLVVVAAVSFGIALGLVLGLFLAKALFVAPSAPNPAKVSETP